MPLGDAYIEIICDECGDSDQIPMSVSFYDYSGRNWYYDQDRTISERCDWEWESVEDHNDYRFICPSCVEYDNEDY